MNAKKLNRKEVSSAAESIRITLQKLARRLEELMDDVGCEGGWPAAYETLSDVRSDIERCDDSLANRFPS